MTEDYSSAAHARCAAQRVREILVAYGKECGQSEEEPAVQVRDLLTDMLHFCESTDIDFAEQLCIAERHFLEELQGVKEEREAQDGG